MENQKGPIQLIFLFLHSLAFTIPQFLSLFHSFDLVCKGSVFSTGFPLNIMDLLKTYKMISYELQQLGNPKGRNHRARK